MKRGSTSCDRLQSEKPVTVSGEDETNTVAAVCQISETQRGFCEAQR